MIDVYVPIVIFLFWLCFYGSFFFPSSFVVVDDRNIVFGLLFLCVAIYCSIGVCNIVLYCNIVVLGFAVPMSF